MRWLRSKEGAGKPASRKDSSHCSGLRVLNAARVINLRQVGFADQKAYGRSARLRPKQKQTSSQTARSDDREAKYRPTPLALVRLRVLARKGGGSTVGTAVKFRLSREGSMRLMSFSAAILLALLLSAARAQQPPGTAGDTIGHPPPLPGPPPISEPSSTTKPVPAASTPRANEPASKGYTGAYAPAGTPPTPYSTGPLPLSSAGPGLNVPGPDGVSTRTVKAVPCGTVARETDGFTTCVGIPDQSPTRRRR